MNSQKHLSAEKYRKELPRCYHQLSSAISEQSILGKRYTIFILENMAFFVPKRQSCCGVVVKTRFCWVKSRGLHRGRAKILSSQLMRKAKILFSQ